MRWLEIFTTYTMPWPLHATMIMAKYWPLKTAPNLRYGWQLQLRSLDETTLALIFYPAALGTGSPSGSQA
jgi:hypothetical protein